MIEAKNEQPKAHKVKLAKKIKEYRNTNPEKAVELLKIADFFEDIGLLVNKRLLHPPDLALEMFAGATVFYWEEYKEYTDLLREEFERQDIYEWFGYLYRISKAYSEAKLTYQGPPETRPNANRLFRRLSNLFK